MLDISNAVHAWSFSALMVFTWARKPNKPTVGPKTRPGIHQEWWCHLWQSGFNNIYVHTWPSGISWGSERPNTVDHCLRLKRRTSMTQSSSQSSGSFRRGVAPSLYCFVVADWHICGSGGLVINRNPQFFTTFIVKAASVTFHGHVWHYIISSELVYIA